MYGDVATLPSTVCGPAMSAQSWGGTSCLVFAEEGYSVEFFDMTGNTVGVVTLPATALRMPQPAVQLVPTGEI